MQLFKRLLLGMTLASPTVASIKSVAATRAETRLPPNSATEFQNVIDDGTSRLAVEDGGNESCLDMELEWKCTRR